MIMQGLILKNWKRFDGKVEFPKSETKKVQKCFHEKQTEPRPGDPLVMCENCRRCYVDVDAMRAQLNAIPNWVRKIAFLLQKPK
jgi:hypothetical protein